MSGACQVDFYVLQRADQAAPRIVCRLAQMAWEKGNSVRVAVSTHDELEELDALMWNFPTGRFLPHRLAEPADAEPLAAPIILGTCEQHAASDADGAVMINLTPGPISEPRRFPRILEIVPYSPQHRADSRQKFRQYRDMGLDPASHELTVDTGR